MDELYDKLNAISDSYFGFVMDQADFHEYSLAGKEMIGEV